MSSLICLPVSVSDSSLHIITGKSNLVMQSVNIFVVVVKDMIKDEEMNVLWSTSFIGTLEQMVLTAAQWGKNNNLLVHSHSVLSVG